MQRVIISLWVLVTLLALGSAAPAKICPKIDEFVELNFEKYQNKKWYSVYRPDDLDHELCMTYKYENVKNVDGLEIPFLKKTFSYKANSSAPVCYDTDSIELAILSNKNVKGTIVAYEDLRVLEEHSYNYTVLATDYETYTIEYRCEDGEGPQVWVHSIEKELNAENEKLVQHSLKLNGLPALESLNKIAHDDTCATEAQQCTKKIK